MEISIDYFIFRHPFTCLVVGPTSSGKTVLVRRFLKNYNTLVNFSYPVPQLKVMWAFGQYQPLYSSSISDNVLCNYIPGLPTEQEIKESLPHIIVIDDLMTELGGNRKLTSLFTKLSHHLNISVIFITQNLYHQGKEMRNISLNSHYYFIMNCPRDKAQKSHFARSAFPETSKSFLESYADAISTEYGYIKLDFTQKTPDKYRVQSRITPEEVQHLGLDFSPIVYVPK